MPSAPAIALSLALAAVLASPRPAQGQPVAAPDPAPFAPGEQIDVAIDYLHVHTGQASFRVGRPEGAVWPVICQARTDGLGSLLDIREHYVTYWDAETQQPRGNEVNAIELGDRHTDQARFDRERGKAVVRVVRRGKAQERTFDVPPDVHDLASALLALRLRPLAPGSHLELPVFSGASTFTLRADGEARETLTTPAGRFDTLRVRVQLGFRDRFRTTRDAYLWLSADDRRIPVRMSADFAVGSVTVTLTGYRPGSQLAATR